MNGITCSQLAAMDFSIERIETEEAVRHVLSLVDVCESPLEVEFVHAWALEVNCAKRLRDVRKNVYAQYQIESDESPSGVWRIDFFWPESRLAVEIDGYAFHSNKRKFTLDRMKFRELGSRGIRVLPFSGSEVFGSVFDCTFEVKRALHIHEVLR